MKKKFLIFVMAAALFGTSCEDFLSVNETNPDNASSVPADLLLPAAINNVARTMNNPRRFEFIYLWHGLWSISATYSQPMALTQYRLLNSSYQNAFNEFYTAGRNLDVIENTSIDIKDSYFKAIAMIMKAYIFQNLVDCWGNVPYTDAFKGADDLLKPTYDAQQAIYEDLIVKLDEAMALIANAPLDANIPSSTSDIVYSGDMTKWLHFANTLKLRILIHQADMSGRTSYITTALGTTLSYGFIGAGESALADPGYLQSEDKMNIFYETFYKADGSVQSDGETYFAAGRDVIDYMKATADVRLGKFFRPYDTQNHYDGNVLGTTPLTAAASTSKLGYIEGDAGTMIGTPEKPCPLLTDFESLFIQAEAAQRGLISGDAKALYESAITQSYLYMNLTASDAADFYTQENAKVGWDQASNKIELIINQKWVSLDGIAPVEIWDDYRRTGFPANLNFSQDPQRQSNFPPIRLLYPQTEVSYNNDNVVAVGTIDAFTSKIFWAK